MSMMIESQIKFYIESNRMSRDDMLKLFRAEPERSWSIGDKYTCHVGLHKSNGMFFSPHVAKNATVEDKLAAMAKMLEDSDFDAVRQANKSLRGEFRIGLDLYSDEGCSFVLPRNLISVAQRLSMPIDIDAIFLTESEESSTPYESAVGLFVIKAGEVVVLGRSIGIEAVESVLQYVSTSWSHKERQYNQCTLSIAGERPVIVLPLCFLEICNGMCKEFKIEVKARKDLILNYSIVQ